MLVAMASTRLSQRRRPRDRQNAGHGSLVELLERTYSCVVSARTHWRTQRRWIIVSGSSKRRLHVTKLGAQCHHCWASWPRSRTTGARAAANERIPNQKPDVLSKRWCASVETDAIRVETGKEPVSKRSACRNQCNACRNRPAAFVETERVSKPVHRLSKPTRGICRNGYCCRNHSGTLRSKPRRDPASTWNRALVRTGAVVETSAVPVNIATHAGISSHAENNFPRGRFKTCARQWPCWISPVTRRIGGHGCGSARHLPSRGHLQSRDD